MWREDFTNARQRWSTEGDAFGWFPQDGQVPKQDTVGFRVGAYANSFAPDSHDGATGRAWTSFEIVGDAITLRIGGGKDSNAARVSLLVDGRRLYSATGCQTEVLGIRTWNVADLRGKTATLEIADQSSRAWGHIIVDEVVQWRRRAPR